MQIPYDPKKIEPKWQKKWQDEKLYEADDVSPSPKFYSLIEFPYPSGAGLHTGHIRSNTAMDIISRKRRMEGWNVLYPIGWDAFGLPTENFAIKTGKDPAVVTKENTDNFRRQLQSLGFSFDWSREINTTDPAYYKWTQWIFLQMYKKGLAYKAKMTINWCPKDKIGLANEEVIDGKCERCGTQVEKREKEQWMLAITKYADRLDKDLDTVDFQERIKIQQRNWIGRSEGAEIEFPISNFQFPNNEKTKVKVFTTRPDTLFGATYLVLAPEYPFIENLKFKIKNWSEVELYIKQAKQKSEIDRTAETKDKTGVRLDGVTAVNPVTNEEIPMFVADYVLAHYGTGAIMAVPAHDARDFEFAKKFGLPIQEVVMERLVDAKNPHVPGKEIVFRDAVIAAVRDPKTGKFLILKWKKQPWTTFVMGGIEKGEDAATAAAREILEETGYKNVKVVKTLREAQSEFYAAHKGVNRVAHTRNLILELVNDEREKISDEESEIHEIAWMSLDEIRNAGMTHSEMPIFYEGFESIEIPFTGRGILTNSGKFDGMSSEDAAKAIVEAVGGKIVTTYKLRDWVFSRQRYWGEPIPLIHCDNCGWQPVPEEDLPVRLPKVEKYEPTDDGESPLSKISEWVNVKCPNCGGDAKRETDTMPQWAGSSWYYLRYADPHNAEAFADASKLKKWLPVDWYNGGMEHTTLHLLYSRFWHKFLFDQGLVPTSEPYAKRTSHGLILAQGGVKMSKSKGNVVNPDDIVEIVGADTLRIYEMFMGPFDQPIAWSTDNMVGSRRFLEKVWKLREKVSSGGEAPPLELASAVQRAIKKVGEDIESMGFNTAVSTMMILANEFERTSVLPQGDYEALLKLLAPFAPHIAEELWHDLGHAESIHLEKWPAYDPSLLSSGEATIVFQVNGKVRGTVSVEADAEEEEVRKRVLETEEGGKWLGGHEVKRTVFVKNRLINFLLE